MNTPRITETALANMIIKVAREFVGLVETRPNAQWDDAKTKGPDPEINARLIAMMRPAPWEPGWAHCAAFVEGVVCVSLERCGASQDQIRQFSRIHTPHVMSNVRAFTSRKLLSPTPSMGALGMAQHGTTDRGHEWIVTVPVISPGRMGTIESNTSAGPAQTAEGDREGDWITEKTRAHNTNGKLRTRGFLSVASILKLIE